MPAFAPVTIAGLSALSGVEVEVIRLYVAIGLVPPPRRQLGRAGEMAFLSEHLDRLKFIARALALGFSLTAIRELLGTNDKLLTCGDVYLVAERTLAAIWALGIVPSPTLERIVAVCPRRGGRANCPILAELARPS
jgi:DNA-binding transcriptional MerR regulator